MLKSVFFALLLAVVCAGCRSDIYYQNRAVERARKYLLENCSDLTPDEGMFVRYNAPVLLHAPLLGEQGNLYPGQERLHSPLRQICVTWLIPGRKDLVMVFGVSHPRMDAWEPNRILIRDYSSHVPAINVALDTARNYAKNNFFRDLNTVEVNAVRFSYPGLLRTSFELSFDVTGKQSDAKVAEALEKAENMVQYSLVWKLGADKNLVITGLSDRKFSTWDIMLAEIMNDAELEKHTVAVVLTPAQGLNAMPEGELDKLSGWEE